MYLRQKKSWSGMIHVGLHAWYFFMLRHRTFENVTFVLWTKYNDYSGLYPVVPGFCKKVARAVYRKKCMAVNLHLCEVTRSSNINQAMCTIFVEFL